MKQYTVRVQIYQYEVDDQGHVTDEKVVARSESVRYDRITVRALYRRACDAAETTSYTGG